MRERLPSLTRPALLAPPTSPLVTLGPSSIRYTSSARTVYNLQREEAVHQSEIQPSLTACLLIYFAAELPVFNFVPPYKQREACESFKTVLARDMQSVVYFYIYIFYPMSVFLPEQAVGMPPMTHSGVFCAAPGSGTKVGRLSASVIPEPQTVHPLCNCFIRTPSLISALDPCRRPEARLLTPDSVPGAQSRGWIRGSAFSGPRGSLCRLVPEAEAHILTA